MTPRTSSTRASIKWATASSTVGARTACGTCSSRWASQDARKDQRRKIHATALRRRGLTRATAEELTRKSPRERAMQPKEMFDVLAAHFGPEVIFDFHADPKKDKDPWFQVKPYEIEQVAEFLKTDPRFSIDTLECLTGVDYPDKHNIVVVYHLFSYSLRHPLLLKPFLPREDPALPPLVNVWPVANWHERQCYDLLGVLFEGHPDLRRLLLPDDWEGYPLRKDYGEKDDYHGSPTMRPHPPELFQIGKAPAKA